MTDAERWADANGFHTAGEFENKRGEQLADLLDQARGVQTAGALWPRWEFGDGSSIIARNGLWEVGRHGPREAES